MKPRILVILGQTATGKSDLAVKLAKKHNGEIISADSRQVYKGLNLGTGKITKKEMQGVPHDLLDVTNPRSQFTVADYVPLANKAIQKILEKGKLPILCGGTGLYIQTLIDGNIIPNVPPNIILRKRLDKLSVDQLFNHLKKLDPIRAGNIDAHNPRRLIRAIEIATACGKVPRLIHSESNYDPCIIGLYAPLDVLRNRIHDRLIKRLRLGMIAEVRHLHNNGLSWKRMDELGLEYRYISRFLIGKLNKDEMIEKLETEIYRYAKRQLTWFKRDRRIHWYDVSKKNVICYKH